jgi:DNA modification methylase
MEINKIYNEDCLQAIKYDRKFVGSELVKEYFNIAQQRINYELSQTKQF